MKLNGGFSVDMVDCQRVRFFSQNMTGDMVNHSNHPDDEPLFGNDWEMMFHFNDVFRVFFAWLLTLLEVS